MKKLNPEKLTVEYRTGVTKTEPVMGRKYTITHSDTTAELFMTIGIHYAEDKITKMRDEVRAEWRALGDSYLLLVNLHVDGENGAITTVRNAIFRRELPLALEALRYGDDSFFNAHPELDHAQIWVHFESKSPYYDKFENWGMPIEYR